MKKLLIIFFAMGSLSASADCVGEYKSFITSAGINAAAGMLLPPLGIYNSYVTHQARKMRDLIKEAKQSRVGKRTKGLIKSLNGLMSIKAIQREVLNGNKKGKFCRWVKDPNSRLGQTQQVVLYRDFKDRLRLQIDMDRIGKNKAPIWNDREDLVQK